MLSLLRSKDTTKSITTLRAVSANTKHEKSIRSVEGEPTSQSHLPIDDDKSPSPVNAAATSPKSTATWRKKHIRKLTGTKRASKKTKPIDKHASVIGTYKDGKIQWHRGGQVVSIDSDKIFQGEDKGPKPNTDVAVLSGRCNQPLPPLPFFDSSFDKLKSRYSIPPSLASPRLQQDAIVSPSEQPQAKPILRHSRRPMSQPSLSEPRSPGRPRSTAEMRRASMYSCSIYSQKSNALSLRSYSTSKTSFEADTGSKQEQTLQSLNTTASKADAGSGNEEDHRKAPPTKPPRKYAHESSAPEDAIFQATCGRHAIHNTPHAGTWEPKIEREPSKQSGSRQSIVPSPRLGLHTHHSGPCSPTLSEAECDLHQHLACFDGISNPQAEDQDRTPLAQSSLFQWDVRSPSTVGDHAPVSRRESALDSSLHVLPPLPPKSSKRQSVAKNNSLSLLPRSHIASQVRRGRPGASKALKLMIPPYKRTSVDVVFSLLPVSPDDANSTEPNGASPIISPAGAEAVILNILQHLNHLDDLFATARVDHGFYRVFKRHELDLIKSTLRAMSPPAWEFREIAFPGHDLLHAEDLETTRPEEEYTPATYLQNQKRDTQVIRAIKLVILEKCQSFVRPEIMAALMSTAPSESSRVDDALWRIWTFCTIFGSGKGRENDLVAQMDWLNGGTLAHQETCTFTMSGTDLVNDTLVGMSESFGKGNEGGLSAEQLFDIMELWNCLAVLLQSFEGRTAQARQAGIYDNTLIRGGDIDGEEMILDEWCYYLLTFGPAAVLKLTGPYHPSDPKGFTIAAENGWVNWKPPAPGHTRRRFLTEAASRIYEDKIAHTYARISTRDVQRQQSKLRIQRHINEIRQRRTSGDLPRPIHMSQERPMSDWDTVLRNLTRPPLAAQDSTSDVVTHVPALRSSGSNCVDDQPAFELPASTTPSPPRTALTRLDHRNILSNQPMTEQHPPLPQWPRTAPRLLPSPSISSVQSNRDLYTLGSPSSAGTPPRRTVAQPLLPNPSTTTASHAPDWHAYTPSTFMPPVLEDAPAPHSLSASPAAHQYFTLHHRRTSRESSEASSSASPRSAILQQHERQNSIYSSPSHEHTAEKAVYRIVEMGFTPEQARDALRRTDLGTGLRVDCAVELLLNRQV